MQRAWRWGPAGGGVSCGNREQSLKATLNLEVMEKQKRLWYRTQLKIRVSLSNMNIFRRTKKTVTRGPRGQQPESSGSTEHTTQQEIHNEEIPEVAPQVHSQDESIWLIDSQGTPIRRRGRTTCQDIQNLPSGTRVNIEINANGIPCNIPESALLASYLGVIARDATLAPISFPDWRNPGMESFKRCMVEEVEEKFAYPLHIRPWIRSSLALKWRNYKTSLKAAHWDSRPIQEILENVPDGVDLLQWAQLVTRWNEPRDKERATQNTLNAQKQKCPHTMGRTSSVRRQQETSTEDRLLLWKLNRVRKDGSWVTEEAKQKWELACQMLSASNLTPEDANSEENERVFKDVTGPEHPGRVRCKGFGVTPTKYTAQSSTSSGCSSSRGSKNISNMERFSKIEGEIIEIKSSISEMFAYMKKHTHQSHRRSGAGEDSSAEEEDQCPDFMML